MAVDTLTSVIEPVMIVVMGGMVGGMVVAMYMPMFKLIQVVGGRQVGREAGLRRVGEQARFRIHRLLAVLAVAVLAAGSGPRGDARRRPPWATSPSRRRGILCQVVERAAGPGAAALDRRLAPRRGGQRLRRLPSRAHRQPGAPAPGAAGADLGAHPRHRRRVLARPAGGGSPRIWRSVRPDPGIGLDASSRIAPASVVAPVVSLASPRAPRRAARAAPRAGRGDAAHHGARAGAGPARRRVDRRPPLARAALSRRRGADLAAERAGARICWAASGAPAGGAAGRAAPRRSPLFDLAVHLASRLASDPARRSARCCSVPARDGPRAPAGGHDDADPRPRGTAARPGRAPGRSHRAARPGGGAPPPRPAGPRSDSSRPGWPTRSATP